MSPLFKKSKWQMLLFITPTILLFSGLVIYPLCQTFVMSFTEWNGLSAATFIGIQNYIDLFDSRNFPVAMRNSVIFSIVLTLYQLCFATFLAFCLVNLNLKGKKFFKNVFFFPVLLSVTVVAQLWVAIYNGDFGLINQLATHLGFDWQQSWLIEPYKVVIAVVVAESWKGMGYHMLLIYAAMKNVPTMYYEAALIDGASYTKQFFHITLPLISSTLRISFVLCITFGFRAFEMIYVMTGGGPGNYSTTLAIMMYDTIFLLSKYGYGSAIATVIVVICVATMLIINKLTDRFDVRY